jgi:hypothetical protein
MTSGSYFDSSLPNYGWEGGKQWSGADGRYTSNPRQKQWNTYQMTHQFERIVGSPIAGSYCKASYMAGSSGPFYADLESSYRAWLDNSSLSRWTNAQGLQVFNTIWKSSDETRLLAKLMYAVREHDFHAGVSLAEVDKLSTSVVGLVKNLGLGALDLARFNFSNFARRFGASPPRPGQVRRLRALDVPGRFLEMQYCWSPVVNDIYEASIAFEKISNGPRGHRYKVSRKITATEVDTSYVKFPDRKHEARRKYIYEAYEELSALRQMGLANPATIIWERIPWSFVVDWVLPVGSYLQLIGEVPHLRGRFLQVSSVRRTVSGKPTGKAASGPTVNGSVFSGHIESSNFWLNRVPLVSPPAVPVPRLNVAGALQGARIYNAAALATQIFARLSGRGSNTVTEARPDGSYRDSTLDAIANRLSALYNSPYTE